MSRKTSGLILAVVVVGAVVLMSACRPAAPELGTEENPIVWVFVPSGEMERVTSGAQRVADLLHEQTGLFFETTVATDYSAAIEAMCSEPPSAHMGSLATFAYVLASERCGVDAALVSVRYGSPTYTGQVFVRADSGITSLADLAGKTFCRGDALSTSGWIIPSLMLRAEGIDPETDLAEIVDTGAHEASVAGVYNGDCDAGASYVDARTRVEEDYPDVMERLIVIATTPPIPNDGVQFIASMPAEMRSQIVQGLLAIAGTEDGVAALGEAYNWSALEEHDNSFYDPFRQLLEASGLSVEDLMQE